MAKSAAPWTPNPAIAAQNRARPSRQAQPSASRQAQAVRFRQAASFVAPSTYSAFGRMQVPGSEDARVYPFGRQAILCVFADINRLGLPAHYVGALPAETKRLHQKRESCHWTKQPLRLVSGVSAYAT